MALALVYHKVDSGNSCFIRCNFLFTNFNHKFNEVLYQTRLVILSDIILRLRAMRRPYYVFPKPNLLRTMRRPYYVFLKPNLPNTTQGVLDKRKRFSASKTHEICRNPRPSPTSNPNRVAQKLIFIHVSFKSCLHSYFEKQTYSYGCKTAACIMC